MNRLAREPLVHFLILGAGLFCLFHFMPGQTTNPPKRIVVSSDRLAALSTNFSNSWGREPTASELQKLIDDFVRQEVYCREAMALGFDRDDPLIRSQLVQNVQRIPDELAATKVPSDEVLNSFANAHPDLFAVGRQFTFSQVFLNPEYHRGDMATVAAGLVVALSQAGDRADLVKFGDPYALPHEFTNASSSDLAKQLGEPFVSHLDSLPIGQWLGPFESKYGLHLVRVRARTEGRMPALEEERGYIRKEWLDAQRAQQRQEFYNSLRAQYTVVLEPPKPSPGATPPAAKP